MKKIKLLVLVMLISTTGMFASNSNNPSIKMKELRAQIHALLKDSRTDVPTEVSFIITFTFSSEGEIVVLDVDSKNPNVLNYVRKNINYKKIDKPGKRDAIYKLPMKFQAKYKC